MQTSVEFGNILSNVDFIVTNISILACTILAIYLMIKGRMVTGGLLFLSYVSDYAYRLILVYSDISFSSSGMESSSYVQVIEIFALMGKVSLPLAIWLLMKQVLQKSSKDRSKKGTRTSG